MLKGETVRALRGVSFDVPEGDLLWPSWDLPVPAKVRCSTLGCLDKQPLGGLYLGDDNVAAMSDDQLAEIRSRRIGFVFRPTT